MRPITSRHRFRIECFSDFLSTFLLSTYIQMYALCNISYIIIFDDSRLFQRLFWFRSPSVEGLRASKGAKSSGESEGSPDDLVNGNRRKPGQLRDGLMRQRYMCRLSPVRCQTFCCQLTSTLFKGLSQCLYDKAIPFFSI